MSHSEALIVCYFKHKKPGCCTDICSNELVGLCSATDYIHVELYLRPARIAVRLDSGAKCVSLINIDEREVYHRPGSLFEGFEIYVNQNQYASIHRFCSMKEAEGFSSCLLWCMPLRCLLCCNSADDRYWSVPDGNHPQTTWVCSTFTATALGAASHVYHDRTKQSTLNVSPSQLYQWFIEDGKRENIFTVQIIRQQQQRGDRNAWQDFV